jgi:hypothetical protein
MYDLHLIIPCSVQFGIQGGRVEQHRQIALPLMPMVTQARLPDVSLTVCCIYGCAVGPHRPSCQAPHVGGTGGWTWGTRVPLLSLWI